MNPFKLDVLERPSALLFASAAHAAVGQKNKYTGSDYIAHPIEVAEIIRTVEHTEAMIDAALLHDVVEDTNVTTTEIRVRFGNEVADLVAEVTDISTKEDGNRAARKKIDREHNARASAQGQTIKVADLISNTKSIVKHDPHFARLYLKEKQTLLAVLTKADPVLHARATALLHQEALRLKVKLDKEAA